MLDTLDEEAGWKLLSSPAFGILDVFLFRKGEIQVMEGEDFLYGVPIQEMQVATYRLNPGPNLRFVGRAPASSYKETTYWPLIFSRRAKFSSSYSGDGHSLAAHQLQVYHNSCYY